MNRELRQAERLTCANHTLYLKQNSSTFICLSLFVTHICRSTCVSAYNKFVNELSFNRGFPKVDHHGRSFRIVLEQINSAKKIPLTGLEPLTLGLSVLLTSCLSCLTPVLDPIA